MTLARSACYSSRLLILHISINTSVTLPLRSLPQLSVSTRLPRLVVRCAPAIRHSQFTAFILDTVRRSTQHLISLVIMAEVPIGMMKLPVTDWSFADSMYSSRRRDRFPQGRLCRAGSLLFSNDSSLDERILMVELYRTFRITNIPR